jgi:hypothetical protein
VISGIDIGTSIGRLRAVLAAAALAAAFAAPAAAATCTVANVKTSVARNALACVAGLTGGPGSNVTTAQMNASSGVFDKTGWIDLGKVDLPGTAGGLLEIGFDADARTGTWKLRDGLGFAPGGHYALALKAGAVPGGPNGVPKGGPNGKGPSLASLVTGTGPVANAVYLLDITGTSGTWSTADLINNGGQVPELSNITLFGTVAPVPLPAAAWLLVGGLAGLGAVARRRRTAPAA